MTGTDDTLGLRVAAVFIVATVSLLGCLVTVIVGTKEQDSARTNRLLKCLGAGVIACVGFVHVLPDAVSTHAQSSWSPVLVPDSYVVARTGRDARADHAVPAGLRGGYERRIPAPRH